MATRQSYSRFNGTTEQGGQQGGQDVMSQMRSTTQAMQSRAQNVVEEYPLSTVLAVFGLGLGVGVALGTSLFSSSSSSRYASNWLPSGSSSWLPSSAQASWFGNNNNPSNWFGNNPSNWSDSLVQGAKSMCGY